MINGRYSIFLRYRISHPKTTPAIGALKMDPNAAEIPLITTYRRGMVLNFNSRPKLLANAPEI